jgi:multiple sugar transport system ATP-binding protein
VEVAGQLVDAPADAAPSLEDGDEVVYGVRPEYMSLTRSPVDGALSGTVSIVENLGSSALVSVECDGHILGATVPEGAEPDPGANVWLTPTPGRVLLYRTTNGELVT